MPSLVRSLVSLCLFLLVLTTGCVHRIHVNPTSAQSASARLPFPVSVQVPFIAMEGADHMPGIVLLEWPTEDLRDAIIRYLDQRGTFGSVVADADTVLTVKSWLTLRAPDHYIYAMHLEAELGQANEAPLGTYAADAEAKGSTVRWVTESDRAPIEAALQEALDKLVSKIEADAASLRQKRER